MKVNLVKTKLPEYRSNNVWIHTRWTQSKPFVENSRGDLIHRPHDVTIYKLTRNRPHLAIGYWCGNSVTGNENLIFLDRPPRGKFICAVCENRAVMAGEKTSDSIVGRHVHKGRIKVIQTCCGVINRG